MLIVVLCCDDTILYDILLNKMVLFCFPFKMIFKVTLVYQHVFFFFKYEHEIGEMLYFVY